MWRYFTLATFVIILIVNYTNDGPKTVTLISLVWATGLSISFVPEFFQYLGERQRDKLNENVFREKVKVVKHEDKVLNALDEYAVCVHKKETMSFIAQPIVSDQVVKPRDDTSPNTVYPSIYIYVKDIEVVNYLFDKGSDPTEGQGLWSVDFPDDEKFSGITRFISRKGDLQNVVSKVESVLSSAPLSVRARFPVPGVKKLPDLPIRDNVKRIKNNRT